MSSSIVSRFLPTASPARPRRCGAARIACASLALAASSASAQTIVNFDGGVGGQTYLPGAPVSATFQGTPTAANINYGGNAATTDRQAIRPFSASAALSPAASTGYPNGVNTSLYSTTFYGAYESIILDAASGTATNSAAVRVGTAASGPEGSVIRGTYNTTAGNNYVGTVVLEFQKANFLNGGSTTGMLSLSSISATFVAPSVATGTASNLRGRWLVQNGSTIYLSQTTFSLDAGTPSLSDFTTTLWSPYTPSTAAGTVLNFQPSSFSTANFNDVQGVGMYAETYANGSQILVGTGNANAAYNLTDFSAVAVPEPQTWALLIVGGFGVYMLRRRGFTRVQGR